MREDTLVQIPEFIVAPQIDRPGWIPAEISEGWDENPYAYQTEEELMPAGGLHGYLLGYIMELLRYYLKQRGLMLLLDVFLLYRDRRGIKQRISPDLLLMAERFPPPSAYDLDVEPPPLSVIEVTSPKSHVSDLKRKSRFYLEIGVPTYLAIDAITPGGKPREKIELHLWRLIGGERRKIEPDREGKLRLPEMGVKVKGEGREIKFFDEITGKGLSDMGEVLEALREEYRARLEAEEKRQIEHQARLVAEEKRRIERQARLLAEERRREAEERERMAINLLGHILAVRFQVEAEQFLTILQELPLEKLTELNELALTATRLTEFEAGLKRLITKREEN